MKSHPLHIWHHRQFIWLHIHSWWHHTMVCMMWHPLGLWHLIHYIWCHPHCVYDYTSSISVLKHVITAITPAVYVITPILSVKNITPTMWDITGGICMPSYALQMTSYPYFMTILRTDDITCTVFMASNALYMTCHLLCIISHSLYVWHRTMPVSLTSHTLCL